MLKRTINILCVDFIIEKVECVNKLDPSKGEINSITIDKVRDAYHKAVETPADENMRG